MKPAESAAYARTLGNLSAKRVIARQTAPAPSFATTLAKATTTTAFQKSPAASAVDLLSSNALGLDPAAVPLTSPSGSAARLPVTAVPLRPTSAPSVSIASIGSGDVPYADLIDRAARKYGIDPALIAAVAHAESGFNPRAGSNAGAKGVMQLMDATARGLGVSDSFDPAQNIDGGAKFLAGLLKQYNGNTSLALAAYNAGPGAVQKYGGIPPYEETQRYVPKVLGLLAQYQGKLSATTETA